MNIVINVNVEDERTYDKVAYAAQAHYRKDVGTITLVDGVNIYVPLVPAKRYIISSKFIEKPIATSYAGPTASGNPVFLT
ncbi:hypothetical protein SAMN04487926_11948 [Paraburkholderia steynii]|uniref:Uncharacterized protein n=1 Tax=Paraburkholderia steynii TaxID=1245441 RepID=A0A7Z7BBC9_9BURK|nr:hypothetical protein [Paraburkholderia steynii]SDI55920.1 hypothetical protein SAMN04487926_11948 [Paraburkholderia steynii]